MSTPDPQASDRLDAISRDGVLMAIAAIDDDPDEFLFTWPRAVRLIREAVTRLPAVLPSDARVCAPGEANIDGTVRPADDLDALRDTLDAIHLAVTISSRDWSIHHRDAWLYGVVAGWDDEHPDDDAMPEVAERHGWDAEMVATIRFHHAAFTAARLAEGPSDG